MSPCNHHSVSVGAARTSYSAGISLLMALVVICGQPSSGKSQIAEKLNVRFSLAGATVVVVDEQMLHMVVRDESYKNSVQEKHTRGKLKSAVERALAEKGSIVILDSLNNIKVR